jgi:ADP-ribose pyrophosphatase YjhB (NUDIX family)
VGAVAVEEDCLLLVQRGTPPGLGRWSIPGGRVEPGETLAAATVREVYEETGQVALCESLIGWAEIIDEDVHFVILDFRVSVPTVTAPVAGDDARDAAWVPLGSLAELDLVDGLADFLEQHGVIERIRPFTL